MLIIQEGNQKSLSYLLAQGKNVGGNRPMKYCIQHPVEDGMLLLNHVTMELLFVSHEEMKEFFTTEYACEHWFSVPEETDELALVQKLRKELAGTQEDQKLHSFLMYLVFTTTCCNARCPYCYEIGHHNNITMKKETAEKVADFIMERTLPEQTILLAWMGGEPLLNTAAMDIICNRIRAAGRKYMSNIATNAYLFSEELVQKAADLWQMDTVQITIDGLEEEYNTIKGYTDKSAKLESPFQRVLGNIGKLLNAGIKVSVHLYVSENNGDDIIALIALLFRKFGPNKNLDIVICSYFQRIFDEFNAHEEETEKAITDNFIRALEMTRRCGYYRPKMHSEMQSAHCNPDRNRQLNIMPDGKIGWCDDIIDRDFIGTIDSQKLDSEVILKYKERMEDLPECTDCPLYPGCIRLKCCFRDLPWCTSQFKRLKRYKLEMDMSCLYQKKLSKMRKYEK
ncbi:MAG: radical SAM protein [Ruminococcaceae bacterium]|nr:radical SAM protein [Oscillospiraceae bacterium]